MGVGSQKWEGKETKGVAVGADIGTGKRRGWTDRGGGGEIQGWSAHR